MAENEGQKKTKSTSDTHIQNLVFVPQGCSYFLDTTDSKENDPQQQQYIGLITQGCGPCACIIVRNRDNTKMVLAHVDSGNDITDEEFGLPKWVRQCKGDVDNNNRDNDNNNNGNNNDDVIVEVHMGCGQVGIKKEDGTNRQEQAILGFERTIRQLQDRLNFTYDGHDRSPGSQGGMILKNGYHVVIDEIGTEQRKPWNRTISHKILQDPEDKNGRTILNSQISFNNEITDKIYKKIKKSVLKSITDTTNKAKHNVKSYIENTLILPGDTKADSEFCQEHNIKVLLIPLDEINKFENVLTKEFRNRIDNQPYMKSQYDYYWQNYVAKRRESFGRAL